MSQKIEKFTDLNAWREAHKFGIDIYKATRSFPKEEVFGLTSQIRRAVVSVSSNIAEGFSRYNAAEKKNFYRIAKGSLVEVESQLLIARDVGYLNKEVTNKLLDQAETTGKLLTGLINGVSNR